jgi:hypothetical protein
MARYVIVANRTLGGERLLAGIDSLLDSGPVTLFLVVPVTTERGALPRDREASRTRSLARLHRELARLRERGVDATGEVITDDVVERVRELTREHRVDAVLVSTLPPRISRWLRMDLITRLAKAVTVPVRQIEGPPGPPV